MPKNKGFKMFPKIQNQIESMDHTLLKMKERRLRMRESNGHTNDERTNTLRQDIAELKLTLSRKN